MVFIAVFVNYTLDSQPSDRYHIETFSNEPDFRNYLLGYIRNHVFNARLFRRLVQDQIAPEHVTQEVYMEIIKETVVDIGDLSQLATIVGDYLLPGLEQTLVSVMRGDLLADLNHRYQYA